MRIRKNIAHKDQLTNHNTFPKKTNNKAVELKTVNSY